MCCSSAESMCHLNLACQLSWLLCSGASALHAAVKAGALKAVRLLLTQNVDINAFSIDGYAPLHEAASNPVITGVLLDHGADPRIQHMHNSMQPLHMAACHGASDVCQKLLSAGADINAVTRDGVTPLHEAAEHAQPHIIKLLIAHKAACMAEDKYHRTALSAALTTRFQRIEEDADQKLVDSVTALLAHGNGNRRKGQRWPMLTLAAQGGHVAVIQLLLNKGAAASHDALNTAAQYGHVQVVKVLVNHWGSAKQPPGDKPNALHWAARPCGDSSASYEQRS